MKVLKYIAIIFSAVLAFSACSEDALDKVNQDRNHTKDANANFIFAEIPARTAISIVGGDYNTYFGVAVEHWAGVHNQLYQAEKRTSQWNSSSTFNNAWNSHYETLKNTRLVIDKCADGAEGSDAGNAGLRGMAEVMFAYNLAVLTDLYGDTPYSQALDYKKTMTPAIDSQESIYAEIKKTIDAAISDLSSAIADGSGSGAGQYDFIYGGDVNKWLKFAYGLRARLTMHTILRSSNKNADYEKIVADCDNSFSSRADEAAFNKYDNSNLNPLFDFEWSRDGIAISQSMFEKLDERQDPRRNAIYFDSGFPHLVPGDEELDIYAVPNGEGEEVQYAYSYDCFVFAQTASTLLLSYHEVQFLKAEALARLNRPDEAKAAAKEAIIAAFENTQASLDAALAAPSVLNYGGLYYEDGDDYEGYVLDAAEAEAYYDAVVEPLSGEDLLAEIMVQKYIAFYGASGESVEAYNDYRRMLAAGENYVVLSNPANAAGKFPLRAGYGSSDTTANPNVHSAFGTGQYVYSEPVWWAGGTR